MMLGTVLLAACLLCGRCLGESLARALGIDGDVGGVGFAMVALMLGTAVVRRCGLDSAAFRAGLGYWAGMYIPIVVAMAATQNVVAAVRGGWVAVLAGGVAVFVAFAAVPLLAGRPAASVDSMGE